MVGHVGKATWNWEDMVDARIQSEREDQWGEMDGEIISFDPTRQIASVQPLTRVRIAGQMMTAPVLIEVPVRFVRAGGSAVTYPVKPGDRVTLRPKMRGTENYHDPEGNGGAHDQSDTRSFNLSDMEAYLDGGESLNDPIPNFDPQNMHMRFDPDGKFGVKGSPDGKISIEGAEGNVYDIIASMFELIASDQLQINYGSSGGTGHALQNRAQLMELAAKLRSMSL